MQNSGEVETGPHQVWASPVIIKSVERINEEITKFSIFTRNNTDLNIKTAAILLFCFSSSNGETSSLCRECNKAVSGL